MTKCCSPLETWVSPSVSWRWFVASWLAHRTCHLQWNLPLLKYLPLLKSVQPWPWPLASLPCLSTTAAGSASQLSATRLSTNLNRAMNTQLGGFTKFYDHPPAPAWLTIALLNYYLYRSQNYGIKIIKFIHHSLYNSQSHPCCHC
jgi:hypothetical protein